MLARLVLIVLAVVYLPGYVLLRAGEDATSPPLRFSRGFVVPIHVHSAGYTDIPYATLRDALEAALTSWHVGGSTLRFARDAAGVDGDTPAMDGHNVVRFETRGLPPEVDPGSVLAFTSPVSAACTGVLLEVDVTFNAVTVTWSTDLRSRRADVETVALHEFGHLLGLDHTNDRDAVMYPSIVDRVRRDLHPDDLAGVRALYGDALGLSCVRDADCRGGEVCLFTLLSDESVATACGPPVGRAAPGGRCDADGGACENGCANGLCDGDGVCSALCRTDVDCPGQQTCLPQDVGDGTLVNFCVDLTLCEDAVGACPAGQACAITDHPVENRLLRLCVDAGRTPLGEPCVEHGACAGALCIEGRCTGLCDRDADCGGVHVCITEAIPLSGGGTQDVGFCALPTLDCARPSDCPAPLECAFTLVDGQVRTRCLETSGAPAGAVCGRHDTCRSNLCLSDARRCSDACRADDECPDDMVCGREMLQGQSVPACRPAEPVDSDAEPLPPPAFDAGPGPSTDAAAPMPAVDAAPPGSPADAGLIGPLPNADAGVVAPGVDGGVVVRDNGGGGGGGAGCVLDVSDRSPAGGLPWLLGWALVWAAARRRASAGRSAGTRGT